MSKSAVSAAILLLFSQGDPSPDVKNLIERLRSPEFQDRQEAARRLKDIGPPALPFLELATKDKDAEVVTRAKDLVRQIRLRQNLGPRLLREFPDLDERLDNAKPRTWPLELFKILDDRLKDGELHGLIPLDLEPFMDRAFSGAQGETEVARLIEVSGALGLRSSFPALRRLVEAGGPEADAAFQSLKRADPQKSLSVMIGLLKSSSLRLGALQGLRDRPGAPKVVEIVKPFLKDSESQIRGETANVLGRALDTASAPMIEPLLRDKNPEVREAALRCLQELATRKSATVVRPLLKDPDGNVQREAIKTLATLNAVEAGADIEALARKTKDQWIQAAAADALATLGRREAVGTLVVLSKTPEKDVRQAALNALFRLGARAEAIEAARSFLSSKEAALVEAAAQALGNMDIQESVDALLGAVPGCPPEALRPIVRALWNLENPKAVPVLRKLQEDKNSGALDLVRGALFRIDTKTNPPAKNVPPAKDPNKLLKDLEDTQPRIRDGALLELGLLNAPVPEERMAALLDDPDEQVRHTALWLSGYLSYPGLLPRIRVLTQDPSIRIGPDALRALAWRGELGDRELLRSRLNEMLPALAVCQGLGLRTDGLFQDVLEELLLTEDGGVRHQAGEALCLRGLSVGVAAVLDKESGFVALNAIRSPERFKVLMNTPSIGRHEGTVRELLDHVGKASGIQVEIPSPFPHLARAWWDYPLPYISRWKRDSLRDDLVSALNDLHNGLGIYELVLEGDRVKILPKEDAKLFWLRWWGNLKK